MTRQQSAANFSKLGMIKLLLLCVWVVAAGVVAAPRRVLDQHLDQS